MSTKETQIRELLDRLQAREAPAPLIQMVQDQLAEVLIDKAYSSLS